MKLSNFFPNLLIWATFLFGASGLAFGQLTNCFSPDAAPPAMADCGNIAHYIPEPNDPVKTVKIAFHVMQRAAPFQKDNFDENNPAHVAYLNGLATRVNELYSWCNIQWCSCSYQNGLNQQRDSRIRFELTGIYYHRDNSGYINGDGTYSNLYCYNNYAVCRDEILNVFFCQIPDGTSGYGPPSHVMMFNLYDDYVQNGGDTWGPGNVLGHEFGHVFGLGHSWSDKFQYSDMCQSEGSSASFCANRETDCTCGNNVMSYSRLADYFSPRQMARMHLTLMTGTASKYLKIQNTGNPTIITQPTIWDIARICYNDVLIEPGASLTIQCKTIMAAGTRIVTKRGARLIVDGARATTKGKTQSMCAGATNTERWTGVEVWGNTSVTTTGDMLSENYPLLTSDPGVVTLKNGAIIEHAQVGVFAQQRGTPWGVQQQHFGGLISTNGAEFRNCRKATEYISDVPLKNSSVFNNCIFNQTFLGTSISNPVKTYEGVTSWQVSEMLFTKCSFNNLERGIVLGNSTATVLGSTFDKNKYAIELGMIAPTANAKSFIGRDGNGGNTFKYCDWPVYGKTYGYLIVKNNLFEDSPTGIILDGTSIFKIEENKFKNTNISGNPVFVTGIGLLQSGEASANLITCNEYIALGASSSFPIIRDGIFAGGNNLGAYFEKNKFTCWYDVRLSQLTDNINTYIGKLPDQGGNGNAVFNEYTLFSLNDHKAEIHTPASSLGLTAKFDYYHPAGVCNVSQLIPRKPIQGTCSVSQNGFNFRNLSVGEAPTPPSCSFGPIDGILAPGDCRTLGCLNDYYTQIAQKDALLNPGDASTLYSSLQSSPDAGSTLSALAAASPYLSESVLAAILNASMSENNKVNMLAGNLPLSPYIKNLAQQHLSVSQYEYLIGLEQPDMVSIRDQIAGQRNGLNNKKMALLHHLTDSLVGVGNISAADNLFASDPERFSREARIGLKLQTSNFTGAAQLLASYPTTTQEDTDFKFIQALNLNRIMLGEVPSSTDSANLINVALGYSPQSGYAKTLAGVLYGISFEPVIPPAPKNPDYLQDEPAEDRNSEKVSPAGFTIFPNPANQSINIDIPGEPGLVEILIFDVYGKLLIRTERGAPTTTIDISSFRPGFYVISMAKNGAVQASRYFVKTHL